MADRNRSIAERVRRADSGREDADPPTTYRSTRLGTDRSYLPDAHAEDVARKASQSREAMNEAWRETYEGREAPKPSRGEIDALRAQVRDQDDPQPPNLRPAPDSAAGGLGKSIGMAVYEKGVQQRDGRPIGSRVGGTEGKSFKPPYPTS